VGQWDSETVRTVPSDGTKNPWPSTGFSVAVVSAPEGVATASDRCYNARMHPGQARPKPTWRAFPLLSLSLLALAVLLLGLTPYPQGFVTPMHAAQAHRAAREYGAALSAYRQAAGNAPASPLPWLRTGEVLLLQHRFVEATAAFVEAERRGGGEEAMLGLAESYAGRGDWATAMGTWLRVQASAPQDARIPLALARGSIAQSQFDQAQRYLSQTLRLEPSGPEATAAHALLGRLLAGDDPEQGAIHFSLAGDGDMLAVLDTVNSEPDPARRLLLLGIAALQRGEFTLARRHLERALDVAPDDAEITAYLAHTLDQLGETVAAGKLLERALALDGDSALVYYFSGTHHRRIGYIAAAQADLWQALQRDPENAAFRAEMAESFVDKPDYPGAEEWFAGAVEAAPEDVDFHLMLVHFYLDHLYRVEEAGVPAAQALVELAPGDARAYDLLGWAYHLAGHPAEAQPALLRSLLLDPDLVSAHFHLGSLYLVTGQRDLARSHLQRAADLDQQGFYRGRAELVLQQMGK
jgi:protein O-mannosyl-transferase